MDVGGRSCAHCISRAGGFLILRLPAALTHAGQMLTPAPCPDLLGRLSLLGMEAAPPFTIPLTPPLPLTPPKAVK